jgi:hypothetical protein
MPKRKPDKLQSIRIELQDSEREALDMIAASIAAKNVTSSINNLITPFTQASVAGLTFALSLVGLIAVGSEAAKSGVIGPDGIIEAEDLPPFFFGILPGTVAYAIRNISWGEVSSEFDRRIRDYSPPTM